MRKKYSPEVRRVYNQALKCANNILTALDEPWITDFPKGNIQSETSCPIARLFEAATAGRAYIIFAHIHEAENFARASNEEAFGTKVTMPTALSTFIDAFDNGCMPDLVIDCY